MHSCGVVRPGDKRTIWYKRLQTSTREFGSTLTVLTATDIVPPLGVRWVTMIGPFQTITSRFDSTLIPRRRSCGVAVYGQIRVKATKRLQMPTKRYGFVRITR